VQHNEVAQNQYAPQTVASAGVLVFETNGGVNIEHNILSRNDESVYSDTNAALVIQHNKISDSTFDGIGLISTSGATVAHNFSEGNGFDGIYVSSD
jgi:nitrous oxidase accessory protein NosD